jgi:hypothetical protein
MAIINTYPKATPKGADLLIGTQVKDDNITENSTKSFSVSSIGSFLITSNDITTGSGTTNTLPVWTDGTNGVLGDSFITQTTSPDVVTVNSRLIVSPSGVNALEVTQTGGITGAVTIPGSLKVVGTYYDATSDEGTDGDVLVAKGTPGNMFTRWASLADAGITSGIETAQITVTDAQIRTLGTVPVEILPGVTGKIYQIIGLTVQDIGNAGLTDSYDWSASGDGVFYGQGFASTQHRVEIPNSKLPQGGGSLAPDAYIATPINGSWKSGASVKVSTTTGVDPTVVNSPSAEMIVNITYRLIDLA